MRRWLTVSTPSEVHHVNTSSSHADFDGATSSPTSSSCSRWARSSGRYTAPLTWRTAARGAANSPARAAAGERAAGGASAVAVLLARVGMIHGAALQGISGWRGSHRDICANLERPKIRSKRTQIRQNRGHLEHFSEDHQVGEKCSTILAVFVRALAVLGSFELKDTGQFALDYLQVGLRGPRGAQGHHDELAAWRQDRHHHLEGARGEQGRAELGHAGAADGVN